MKYQLTNSFPHEILGEKTGPFISLYQVTHRFSPDNKKDPILFKNLLKEIEAQLRERDLEKNVREAMMEPLRAIEEDKDFWLHAKEGLAVLASRTRCVVYLLDRPVESQFFVGDNFIIKPLIRVFQSSGEYQVLGLNRQRFKLYEGNRYGIQEIELPEGTPTTMKEILGEELTSAHLSHGSYGGSGKGTMYHGHGGKKDEIEKDVEKFFRQVDRFVFENYSKPSQRPLILSALSEYHATFRNVSHNNYLLEQGIREDFEAMDLNQMKGKTWEIIEPFYLERTKALIESFEASRAQGKGSDDPVTIAKAASESRIGTLLLEADRILEGQFEPMTGGLTLAEGQKDVLDDLALFVLENNGEVVVLPKEKMPSKHGMAAIFRA